jgi:aldose 1-epimerase
MTKTLSGLDPATVRITLRGRKLDLYILTNSIGAEVVFSNYGATLLSFVVPDRAGKPTDIVLGLPNIAIYIAEEIYFGATIGRYSNRIVNGKFKLNGREYTVPANCDPNNLHSGPTGFHTHVFDIVETTANSILSSLISPDGDGGFPGTLQTAIKYMLTDDNGLVMDTIATTDVATVVSITNHAFFNLEGGNANVSSTQLKINGDFFLPTDETNIPFGSIEPIADTNFDFRQSTVIDARIDEMNDEQLKIGSGYDHTWMINNPIMEKMGLLATAAVATSEKTGIVLEVETTLPGIQLYSGNWLSGLSGKLPEQQISEDLGSALNNNSSWIHQTMNTSRVRFFFRVINITTSLSSRHLWLNKFSSSHVGMR